jgi:hypothetical protein
MENGYDGVDDFGPMPSPGISVAGISRPFARFFILVATLADAENGGLACAGKTRVHASRGCLRIVKVGEKTLGPDSP